MIEDESSIIQSYLSSIEPSKAETVQKVFSLMKDAMPFAATIVKWGILLLESNQKEVTGIAARKTFYSIYLSNNQLIEKYTPLLGKVDVGKGCIRFKQLADLHWENFLAMIQEIKQRNTPEDYNSKTG